MDHSENTLRAVIKSLTDAVGPAVDPSDPLATEQLRLSIEFLQFLRTRLEDLHSRARFEAAHAIGMAVLVREAGASEVDAELCGILGELVENAHGALADPAAPESRLADATAQILAAVRDLVRASAAADAGLRTRIESAVLAGSEERIDFDRSWYLPYGFDPKPSTVSELSSILYPNSPGRANAS